LGRKKRVLHLALSACCGVLLLAGLAGDCRQGARMPVAESIGALHARCVDAMVRQTCRVMNDAPQASVPPPGAVFIAGLGAVDATAYAELRQAGESMCRLGADACETASEGSRCKTWRALWRPNPPDAGASDRLSDRARTSRPVPSS
jgi:hypothetical protein